LVALSTVGIPAGALACCGGATGASVISGRFDMNKSYCEATND
jgi:hypothetical protein